MPPPRGGILVYERVIHAHVTALQKADSIRSRKNGLPIAALTAYDYPSARLLDDSGIDVLLVGDSLGMVVLGFPDTTHVTLDHMLHHVAAVARAKPRALVVGDLPIHTYDTPAQALETAQRLVAAGAEAVKLEGGVRPGNVESAKGDPSRPLPNELCNLSGIVPCRAPDGSIESWTLMGNVIYDFAPGATINPFIGVGIGVNRLDVKATGQLSGITPPISAGNPPFQSLFIDDSDTNLAYQALAGLAWKATDRLNVDLTYRYFAGVDSTFRATGSNQNPGYQPGQFAGVRRQVRVREIAVRLVRLARHGVVIPAAAARRAPRPRPRACRR